MLISLPKSCMATIVERDVHHGDSGAMSAIVAVVAVAAVALILGVMLYLFRVYPFNAVPANTTPDINVDIEGTIPTGTPTPEGGGANY
jgi:hypothetical protein